MENQYKINSTFTMGELNNIELLVALAIDKQKELLAFDLKSNSLNKSISNEIAELYSILSKLEIEKIERVND